MNKKQIGITLGIMCFVLTFAIVVQIKTMNSANSTASRSLSDNALRDSILKWKEKYDNASEELKKADKRLEEVRKSATQNDTTSAAKQDALKRNNTLLGLTNVKGNGIVIELADGKSDNSILGIGDSSDKLIHNNDLWSLVNELRNADAEAIEINGQRIVATTAITCEGNVIKVNGEKIGTPFVIKAIGSQGLLYGSLVRSGSYLDIMKERGIIIKIEQVDNLTINKYNGTMNFKYIKTTTKR